jgi:hypothetical protein
MTSVPVPVIALEANGWNRSPASATTRRRSFAAIFDLGGTP